MGYKVQYKCNEGEVKWELQNGMSTHFGQWGCEIYDQGH